MILLKKSVRMELRCFFLSGKVGDLKAAVQCEFLQDVMNMTFDCKRSDVELACYFFIAHSFHNQRNYLLLTLRHPGGPAKVSFSLQERVLGYLKEER